MKNSQLFFNFDERNLLRKSDIVIGEFNKLVIDFLFNSSNWISNVIYIYGQKGVGKSFLSNIYIEENHGIRVTFKDIITVRKIEEIIRKHNLILLEDIDYIRETDEINIFNLYNIAKDYGVKIIFTGKSHINKIHISLPDLRSRLLSIMTFHISNPDDTSLRAIFFKMLSDKQLNVEMDVIDYIFKRTTRNCETIQKIADEIEKFIMKEKKTLNLHTIKQLKL